MAHAPAPMTNEVMNKKPRFDALQAVRVVQALTAAADTQPAPDQRLIDALLTDWRAFLTTNYTLTDDQRQWLASVDDEHDAEIKRLLRQTIASRGRERLVVALVANATTPEGFIHELRHEAVEAQADGVPTGRVTLSMVIAHCDSHCGNWGWGPG